MGDADVNKQNWSKKFFIIFLLFFARRFDIK